MFAFPSTARAFGRALVSLVYADLCLGCDRRLPDPDAGAGVPLCPGCLRRLPPADPDLVRAAVEATPAHDALRRVRALWAYDAGGTVQRVQHALKYAGRAGLGPPLGRLLGAAWQAGGGEAPDAVVPVPLSRLRQLERGYNQAAALAEGVASALGAPVVADALVRTRPTQSQTRLAPGERWANVAGAFAAREPAAWAGRRVLLVDDVLTTGATLGAAALALRAAGATVDAATLAVAGR